MKKTKEEVLNFLGLKPGDKVRFLDTGAITYSVFVSKGSEAGYIDRIVGNGWYLKDNDGVEDIDIRYLIDKDYEIIPQPKKVGETLCKDYENCAKCPLVFLKGCSLNDNKTLQEQFNEIKKVRALCNFYGEGEYIIEAVQKELDKEVEE